MTEAEVLDLAAKAAEWQDWDGALDNAERGEIEGIRAHAATIMENAALKAEVERLREALKNIVNNCGQCGGYGTYPEEETVTGKVLWSDCSSPQCKEARTALERIDHGDR